MSLAKSIDGMSYEATGSKKQSSGTGRAVATKAYKQIVTDHSTLHTLWLLAAKHKVGLLVIGNVVLALNWAFPAWPQLVLSLIGK